MPNSKTSKVEPHFEIVRTDSETDKDGKLDIFGKRFDRFHGRRMVGGETTWTTETMARAVGVERSIISLIRDTLEASSFDLDIEVSIAWTDDNKTEKALYANGVFFPRRVLYVDERTA